MSSRDPNKLIQPFRGQIKKLIKIANEQGIPAFITDTTRTLAEQKELVRKGFSRTLDSKHLKGEAVDIAFQKDGKLLYDVDLYHKLYEIAKGLPYVIWPFKDLKWNWDYPHFQYDAKKKVGYNSEMSLSDIRVDGMPADQRIRELKAQVRRLLSETKRWKDERLKWFNIAKDRLDDIHKLEIQSKVFQGKIETLEDNNKELNERLKHLENQLKDCGITTEQKNNLGLFKSLRDLLRRIIS